MNEPLDVVENESTRPNKSALKRVHQALQKQVAELIGLRPAQLEKLPIDEEFKAALGQARRMQKTALRRQIRYLAGMLAKRDPQGLEQALADLQGTSMAATGRMHRAERWRDRLLEEGDEVLGDLAENFTGVDYQHVRGLVRSILRERQQGKAPRRFRELYRYLYELDQEPGQDPEQEPDSGTD